MAKIKIITTILSKLNVLDIQEKNLIVCRDDCSLYVDISGERIEIKEWIHLDTENERLSLLSPIPSKVYYIKDTNKIWKYVNSNWICLNSASSIDKSDIIDLLGFTPAKENHTHNYLSVETDPTVPAWAKTPNKPSYTATEVGADLTGSASAALASAKTYTDDAMAANQSVINALSNAIDSKSNVVDFNAHLGDTAAHITNTEHDNLTDAISKKHEHGNKTVLDGITASLISTWNAKQNALTIDTAMSSTSVNPVQNKVINTALGLKADVTQLTTTLNAAKTYTDNAYQQATGYTDTKIASIINGASSTIDTLKEVEDAMIANQSVVDALSNAIGSKANAVEVNAHLNNNIVHITNTEHTNLTDAISKMHEHTNKTVLDGITTTLTTAWNAAKTHADSSHARTDATLTEKSTTNGNIKINSTETVVYTHPSGTNPHGTTKTDVALGNVPNVATNDQVPTFTQASTLSNLTSGEKLSVSLGKIMKLIADFIAHKGDTTHITDGERIAWNAKQNALTIDSAMSASSTNPVQNKVIQTALDGKSATSHTHNYAGSSSAGGAATSALACTGNAATATSATTAGACTGNAATATKLATPRTINGVNFDGTANITVPPLVYQTAEPTANLFLNMVWIG